MEVAACEISRLPEELLAAALSLTTPRDACRSAATSVAFRAAADSDDVWARFLPSDLPALADGELSPPPASKKELFRRLSQGPVLLADGLMSMRLERETGAKCYMLSARALQIVWGDTPRYWRWIPMPSSRFSEGAELFDVCWLEISGKIEAKMLSSHSAYAAYLVFNYSDYCYGLTSPDQSTSVTIGGRESSRRIRLQADGRDCRILRGNRRGPRRASTPQHAVLLPRARSDGWMELEMGDFYNDDGGDGEVCIKLDETSGGNWKRGLIVQGIEIRPKK